MSQTETMSAPDQAEKKPERRLNMIEAINDALDISMQRDENVVVMGEDVGYFGGGFRGPSGRGPRHGPAHPAGHIGRRARGAAARLGPGAGGPFLIVHSPPRWGR